MHERISLFEFPERTDSWHRLLPYGLLLTITFALYGTTLYFDFVWDDVFYVERNYRVQGLTLEHLRMIWTGTLLSHYAPVHQTFLAIIYSISGLDPLAYHLGQILLHAACLGLLYALLRKLESGRIALLACLLFAVYPPNIETVAWVSETKSTLAFLFFLLSFWAFVRYEEQRRGWLAALCAVFFVLSMLAKINTIVAPAIFALYHYKRGLPFRRQSIAILAGFFLLAGIFAGVHLTTFHQSQESLAGFYQGGLGVHLMNLPRLVLYYAGMTVLPHPMSAWQMFDVHPEFNLVIGLTWIAFAALAVLLWRSSRTVQFWALWFVMFLAPVLQIIPFGIWAADRYLYIPVVGAFVLVSKGFFWIAERAVRDWQRLGWESLMAAVLVAFAVRTVHHLPVWRDNLTLWEATAQTCPTSDYCHMNLGAALVQNGQAERGVQELLWAYELNPLPEYLVAVGDAYSLYMGDHQQAVRAYHAVLERGNPPPGLLARLARTHLLAGNLPEARAALQASGRLQSNDSNTLMIDSFLQWKLGNPEEAVKSLHKALAESGQPSVTAEFLYFYWRDAAEVGRFLSHYRSASRSASSPGDSRSP